MLTILSLSACGSSAATPTTDQTTGEATTEAAVEEVTTAEETAEAASTTDAAGEADPEEASADASLADSYVEGDFVEEEDFEDRFMPYDYLQYRVQKDNFASYDEIISLLEPGEGYAYITLRGSDADLLIISESVNDNQDGSIVASQASIYGEMDGTFQNLGNVFSESFDYPLLNGNGLIYCKGEHKYETDFISEDTGYLMVKDSINGFVDENGNVSYSGFLRENNNFTEPEQKIETMTQEEFRQYQEPVDNALVINFTVVE